MKKWSSLGSSRVGHALFDDQEETVIIREPKNVRGYRKCFQRTWDKNPQSLFDLFDA
ncbi:hypothetical protein RvY_14331 [Ramazzottius varieornatus]|uniref:Uncharacterized protein n=1 Tax=Ramazzottius varieornatus TaxID=947166 RepID=A0A1D1VW08_RAMVA|nr:hypothetical protein RvY_14331 [Ramazzottius varieornatus]